jgi:LacI family gluconate utilization system Gnt-I transcriptional repressor
MSTARRSPPRWASATRPRDATWRARSWRGYRKIAYLGSSSIADHRAQKRLKGFREGLAEAGLTPIDECFYDGASGFGTGRAMTEQVLTRHPEADFLYYNTDINAAGGLLYCLEKGMDIPGRIGLAGFNSFEVLDGLPMRIATMDSRRFEIGAARRS